MGEIIAGYVLWTVICSFVIGAHGHDRRIGAFTAAITTLLLSPLIGAFVVLASPLTNREAKLREDTLQAYKDLLGKKSEE